MTVIQSLSKDLHFCPLPQFHNPKKIDDSFDSVRHETYFVSTFTIRPFVTNPNPAFFAENVLWYIVTKCFVYYQQMFLRRGHGDGQNKIIYAPCI